MSDINEGGSEHPQKPSPAVVERYIKGIHFPAHREDLVSQAQSNDAPSDIINVLNQMEDKEYKSVVEVAKEVGRVE